MRNPTIRPMTDALTAAVTLADLDALYVDWVGYSAVADDASVTVESLRGDLRDYICEICADSGDAVPVELEGTL